MNRELIKPILIGLGIVAMLIILLTVLYQLNSGSKAKATVKIIEAQEQANEAENKLSIKAINKKVDIKNEPNDDFIKRLQQFESSEGYSEPGQTESLQYTESGLSKFVPDGQLTGEETEASHLLLNTGVLQAETSELLPLECKNLVVTYSTDGSKILEQVCTDDNE